MSGTDFDKPAEPIAWKLPRIPLNRLVQIELRDPNWPCGGEGLFEVLGYESMDTMQERYVLRRVGSAGIGLESKHTFSLSRLWQERGRIRVLQELAEDEILNAPRPVADTKPKRPTPRKRTLE